MKTLYFAALAAGLMAATAHADTFPNQSPGADTYTLVMVAPEPPSLLLLGTGIVLVAGILHRRQRSR